MQRICWRPSAITSGPCSGDTDGDRNGAGALHGNGILLHANVRARLLAIKILHVELQIGHAPGDAIVVADDDGGQSDDGRAGYVQAGRLQMHQVPGRGNGKLQMRIVRENRLAAGRARSRHRPRVRSRLRLVPVRTGNKKSTLLRSPLASIFSLSNSLRQLLVSVRYISRPASMQSRTAQGRGS